MVQPATPDTSCLLLIAIWAWCLSFPYKAPCCAKHAYWYLALTAPNSAPAPSRQMSTPSCSAVLVSYIYVVNYWKCLSVCLSAWLNNTGGSSKGFGASGGGAHNGSSQRVTFARIRGLSADGAPSTVSSLLILWVANTVLLLSKDGVLTFR
jgi:hypothetical protein